MTVETLHDALTQLPADLVAETGVRRERGAKRVQWPRRAALAACLALVLAGSGLLLSGALSGYNAASGDTAAVVRSAEDLLQEEAAADEQAESAAAAADTGLKSGTTAGDASASSSGAAAKMPPTLTLSAGDAVLALTSGNYQWQVELEDGSVQEVIACGAAPTDDPDSLPRLETGQTAAALTFSAAPESLSVRCWRTADAQLDDAQEETTLEETILEDDTLTLLPGDYIYEITAAWPSGSASFAFRIVSTSTG